MEAPKRDWLDRSTLAVALLGVGLGAMSLQQADKAIAVSAEQLDQSRAAFLAFNKGKVSLDYKPDESACQGCATEISEHKIKLTNFGNSPALNIRLTWYPTLGGEWRGDEYTSDGNRSEISPCHLLPEQSTSIDMSNLPVFLNPKVEGSKTAFGVFIVEWTGIDQKRHYTKQQFECSWVPGPYDLKDKPQGGLTLHVGNVVAHDHKPTER